MAALKPPWEVTSGKIQFSTTSLCTVFLINSTAPIFLLRLFFLLRYGRGSSPLNIFKKCPLISAAAREDTFHHIDCIGFHIIAFIHCPHLPPPLPLLPQVQDMELGHQVQNLSCPQNPNSSQLVNRESLDLQLLPHLFLFCSFSFASGGGKVAEAWRRQRRM